MPFRPEPPAVDPHNERVAILWCNLGSPDEATAGAVRRYLAAFLGDPRVVEIPKAIWALILHGIILRVRPAKSAATSGHSSVLPSTDRIAIATLPPSVKPVSFSPS